MRFVARTDYVLRVELAREDFNDWAGVLELLTKSFQSMVGRIDPPSSLNRLALDSLRDKGRDETVILAYMNERLVGCAFAKVHADALYVGKIAVDGQCRRLGIATRLMDRAEQLARKQGVHHLELQTRIELTANHHAFESMGFRKVAETAHEGYTRPTSITMRKALA